MQTNLSEISDPKELKAMAYDQIAAKEQAENNLAAINKRLLQVMNEPLVDDNTPAGSGSVSDEDLGIEGDTPKTGAVE